LARAEASYQFGSRQPSLKPCIKRVAFVTNVLASYRAPCFQKLNDLLPGWINYFFLTKSMSHRGYVLSQRHVLLSATWLRGWRWHKPPMDDRHLNDLRPVLKEGCDVIILGGWDEPTYLLLWLWGLLTRKKVLFWVESTAYEGLRSGRKELYKRLLLKHSAGCIVPGKRAFDYCSKLGMSEDRIFVAPNATDRKYFRSQAERLRSLHKRVREELRVEGVVLVFVGRFVEENKNLSILIEAFDKLQQRGKLASLLLVGDGPDRTRYESLVQKKRIPSVHFLGELNHDQLCQIYAVADIQVLPSRVEPWGFVLNEGMEFGLPLVVSEAVGAGLDLVHPGENGFVFPVGDSDKLAEILELLVKDESLRKRMGQASKRIIEDFTPEAWAQGVVKAIEAVTGKSVSGQ